MGATPDRSPERASPAPTGASPESTRAPFDQPTTLRIISPGGADRIVVTAPDIVGASWSPTGAALAVSTMSTRGIDTLSVYGLDGGAPRKWFVASHDTWIVPDGWWTGRGIGFITVDDGAVPDGSGGTTGGPFYRLAAPGRSPARIGATMIDTGDGGPVATAGGALAYSDNGHLAEGDPRYAWGGKQVEVCPQGSVRCTEVPAPARTSTIDPSWSPTGSTLAYVEATETADPEAPSSIVKAWYGSHRLFLLDVARGSSREVPAAIGVTDEEWSSDGASMLYEADDAMWWLSSLTSTPVKIEAPILPTATWASSSYYGQIDWQDEFAWSAGRRAEPCYYVCGFGTARR
jgi:dipeptidyl aminopeptidase/acylaminoacyl peptidase